MPFSSFLWKKILPGLFLSSRLNATPYEPRRVVPQPANAKATLKPTAEKKPAILTGYSANDLPDALEILAKAHGLYNDYVRQPTPEMVAAAWKLLDEKQPGVADYARAHINLGEGMRLRQKNETLENWHEAIDCCMESETKVAIRAIRNGAVLTATTTVADLIADDTCRAVGDDPKLDLVNVGVVKQKAHVTDGGNPLRPLFARLFKTEGDDYLRADGPEGLKLSIETIKRSGWVVKKGWLQLKHGTVRAGSDKPVDAGDTAPSLAPKSNKRN